MRMPSRLRVLAATAFVAALTTACSALLGIGDLPQPAPGQDAATDVTAAGDAATLADASPPDSSDEPDGALDDGGDADAGFDAGPLASLTFGATAPYGAATAFRVVDVDGDGHWDIVSVSAGTDVVSVFFGTGSGTFAAATNFPTGHAPQSVAIADLNADGKLDLIVAVNGTPAFADGGTTLAGSGVSVLLGTGSRAFAAHTDYTAAPAKGPSWVAAGDVDGDGHVDAVIACHNSGGDLPYSTNSITILFGTGSGALNVAANKNFSIYTDGVNGVAIADFDGDKVADIAYVAEGYYVGGSGASIIFGDKTRAYTRTGHTDSGYVTYGVAIGDINGDGRPDVVAGESQSKSFSVFVDSSSGVLTSHNYVVGSPTGHPALADFNRDGFLDVYINGQIWPGDGTGLAFSPSVAAPFAVDWGSFFGPRSAGVDLDKDGRVDLVGISGGTLSVALSTAQ